MMYDFSEIQKDLEKKLKPERFEHTLGVMYTAASLAMRYDSDIDQAMLAGLLHDCGKLSPSQRQADLCRQYHIDLNEYQKEMPALVHARLGAYLAKEKYGVLDENILDAILYHTTGKPRMKLLEKIIYIADSIEPNRKDIPNLKQIRKVAFCDIDKAVFLSAESTISHLKKSGRVIDPLTIKTYEFYKKA